jgi:hypothetical protein
VICAGALVHPGVALIGDADGVRCGAQRSGRKARGSPGRRAGQRSWQAQTPSSAGILVCPTKRACTSAMSAGLAAVLGRSDPDLGWSCDLFARESATTRSRELPRSRRVCRLPPRCTCRQRGSLAVQVA